MDKKPVVNKCMQKIILASIKNLIDIKGLEPVRDDDVRPELLAFMEDAAKCYFPIKYDSRKRVKALSKDDRERLLSILKDSARDIDLEDVVPIDPVRLTVGMILRGGVNHRGYDYTTGKDGAMCKHSQQPN